MMELQTVAQFDELIKNDKVIILFTADWCPDCKVIEPFLSEIEDTFSTYTFISVDRDKFIDLCQQYDIFGIPSFLAFHEGEEVGRFVSKDRKTKAEIVDFIEQLPQ